MIGNRNAPLCYSCRFRGELPGDAHSCCTHPDIPKDTLTRFVGILGGSRRLGPMSSTTLNVVGNDHGIRMGWFNWPYNFDPTWLETCDGYMPIRTWAELIKLETKVSELREALGWPHYVAGEKRMAPTAMAELLLEQFARRAAQERDEAWKRQRTFLDAAERVMDKMYETDVSAL